MNAILNPNNSYKRLVVGYEAPVYTARGHEIVLHSFVFRDTHPAEKKAVRAELRCPDQCINPISLCCNACGWLEN